MLPFVFLDEAKLGPFHPFGLACALGFFAWDWVVMRQARRKGYDAKDFRALTIWVLAMGTLFAWVIDAVFYHPPGRSVASTLLSFQGFASTGGLVGATVGGLVWRSVFVGKVDGAFRVLRRERPHAFLPVTEIIVSTWPVAWACGRIGCALIHDHPGITVPKGTLGSLFAVAWPRGPEDGTDHALGPLHVVTGGADARFDLGLLELFVLGAIALAFATTWKRDVRPGSYTIAGALTYGPARFLLDFLRTEDGPGGDLRHGGLTFAQYWSLAVIAIGVVLLVRRLLGRQVARQITATGLVLGLGLGARQARAAGPWVDRPMTLPRLVFAGDAGLGVGHYRLPTPLRDVTGVGLNLEGSLGVTDAVELGLRTGIRLGDDGRLTQADAFGRTLWTETYGTRVDTVANPEFRVRWVAYGGRIAEVGLDGRMYLPVEEGSRFGLMMGVPLAFHLGGFVRIDTGAYVPIVFGPGDTRTSFSLPGYFWFQTSDKVWLGPMVGLRFVEPASSASRTDLLLGFGLGIQVASSVDLKAQLFFPRVTDSGGAAQAFGAGFGVQFRIGE